MSAVTPLRAQRRVSPRLGTSVALGVGGTLLGAAFVLSPVTRGLELAVLGAVLIAGAWVQLELSKHHTPADEAYKTGYDIGHEDGYQDGRGVGRPVVVPLRRVGS